MIRICASALLTVAFGLPALGQEYSVAKIDTAAPSDALSPEVAALIQPTGFKLAQGERTVIEIWPAKEWPLAADAKTTAEIMYPLAPGQLVGVARYLRKAADFRDQEIPAGVYTLRYGQQPVDGAHVGTSPTRDFFLLLPAAQDRDPKALEYKVLTTTSTKTTGTAHPGILSLQKAADRGEPLAVREEAEKMWTILRFTAKIKQGSMVKDLPVELVVVGMAME